MKQVNNLAISHISSFAQPDRYIRDSPILTFAYLFIVAPAFSQYSDSLGKEHLRAIVFTETSVYVSTMVGLNELWYSKHPKTGLHFFNDNAEWLQVDKAGHAMTAYYVGKLGMDAMKWTGMSQKKALGYGGSLGLVFLSTVEILDGFSTGWGASAGDIAANVFGTTFLFAQEAVWKEQRVLLKFSFSKTNYPSFRENIMGTNFQEQMLKDYNGQTYWLSANIASFLNETTKFPKWLNAAIGYGADGMLGGKENPSVDNNGNLLPAFERRRQFYLSMDVDLTRIKTKSKFVNTFFNAFGFIKFPAPAAEFTGNKIKIHPLYF